MQGRSVNHLKKKTPRLYLAYSETCSNVSGECHVDAESAVHKKQRETNSAHTDRRRKGEKSDCKFFLIRDLQNRRRNGAGNREPRQDTHPANPPSQIGAPSPFPRPSCRHAEMTRWLVGGAEVALLRRLTEPLYLSRETNLPRMLTTLNE